MSVHCLCDIDPRHTPSSLHICLPKGKYCVYPRMVYSLAIVMLPPPPFWMTENEFFRKLLPAAILYDRSHFSPIQINTQFFIILFWMTETHFYYFVLDDVLHLPKGKYCVYPRMVYSLAIVMLPPPPHFG